MRTIGVSKLVYILFYNSLDRFYIRKPGPNGIYYHRRWGFDQDKIRVEFFYKYNGEIWRIVGKPDQVRFENGSMVIAELKTIRRETSRDIMGMIGYAQVNIYAYGLAKNFVPIIEVYVFNIEKDKEPQLWIRRKADLQYAESLIKKALDRILREEKERESLLKSIKLF